MQIVLVALLLSLLMGVELCFGIVILLALVPVVQAVVSRMLRIRKERSKLTDQQVNILTGMLQGIRVTQQKHRSQIVILPAAKEPLFK